MFENIEKFVKDTIVRENGFVISISLAYKLYSEYCERNNLDRVKRDIFVYVMTHVGFDTVLAGKDVCFEGACTKDTHLTLQNQNLI